MTDNQKASIARIFRAYKRRREKLNDDDSIIYKFKVNDLDCIYGMAMELQWQLIQRESTGDIYAIQDFVEIVQSGCILDYDGFGYLLDANGNKLNSVRCDVRWLNRQANIEDAQYVEWYNK